MQIRNLSELKNNDEFYIFHAATKIENNQILANGGRVLSIVSLDDTYSDCRRKVYEIADKIEWDSKYFRSDIGTNF